MREHLGFLKFSSAVVKVAAWIFLLWGLVGSAIIIGGWSPEQPRWMGVTSLVFFVFAFFLFYVIAKIADLLVKIINEIKKEP